MKDRGSGLLLHDRLRTVLGAPSTLNVNRQRGDRLSVSDYAEVPGAVRIGTILGNFRKSRAGRQNGCVDKKLKRSADRSARVAPRSFGYGYEKKQAPIFSRRLWS